MIRGRSAESALRGLFDLDDKTRDIIYRLVLTLPHPLYLYQDVSAKIKAFAPDKPAYWLAPLRVNRQMNRESSAIAYCSNYFSVVDTAQRQNSVLQAFCGTIGRENGRQLTYICMSFPAARVRSGKVTLEGDDLQILGLLRENCPTIKTVESHLYLRNSGDADWTDDTEGQVTRRVSEIYAPELSTLMALETVVVRVHGGKPAPTAMEAMQNLGWTVLPANRRAWP